MARPQSEDDLLLNTLQHWAETNRDAGLVAATVTEQTETDGACVTVGHIGCSVGMLTVVAVELMRAAEQQVVTMPSAPGTIKVLASLRAAQDALGVWIGENPAGSPAVFDIIAERSRQIAVEGWTPAHDDIHTDGSLARAAAAYALVGSLCDRARVCLHPSSWGAVIRSLWPASWDETWFKPKDRRRDLVRAAALIAAEIERIDRAEAARA